MANLLAKINCASGVLTPDALQSHLEFLTASIRERTRVMSAGGYGIIDNEDPKYNYDGGSKPLWPVLNSGDYTKVTVYPGKAVTPRGDVVEVTESKVVTVASLQRNTVSLIILQNQELQSSQLALTSAGQTVSVGTVVESTIYSVPLESYLNQSIFSADILADVVVLASIVWTDSDVPLLLTDWSNGYTFVRPWFSAVDVEHRQSIGSGEVTATNPHGLGLSDLAVGSMTIYDQLTNSGMVLSKDTSIPGVPGYLCFDQFDSSTIKTDSDGTVTAKSWFSRPGRKYIKLSMVPNMVCGCWTTGNQHEEWAIDWIKGTDICVIVSDIAPSSISVYFVTTATGRIASLTNTNVVFSGVANGDLVITGGLAKTSLLRTSVPLKKYGLIPRRVGFIAGPLGQVYSDPTVLYPSSLVSQLIGKTTAVSSLLPAPGRVGVGLVDGMKSTRTSFCAVQVTGLDTSGNEIQEVLTFDASSWSDTAIPATLENASQVHFTNQVFASVTTFTVLNTESYQTMDVGSAQIIVYLKQEAVYSKFATLATAFWDGTGLVDLKDARRVLTTVREGTYGYTSLHQAAEMMPGIDDVLGIGDRAQLVFAEDFAQPMYLAASTVEWDGLGSIDFDVIPPALADSTAVTTCYRSRQIPMKVDPAAWTRICVVLFDSDSTVNGLGTVRCVFQKDGVRGEAVLHKQTDDGTSSVYVGFAESNWASVSLVISGRARGFACYFVKPKTIDSAYTLTII